MQGKKQQLEPDMEQLTGSKLGKEYVKAVYCHPDYLTYKQNVWMHAKSLQSFLTLFDPTDYSPPGSSVYGILQERILEWVARPSTRGSSQPRDWTCVPGTTCIAGRFFTTEPLRSSYMQSVSYKMPGWKNLDSIQHKLESRLLEEISTTSDMQMIPL